MRKRNHRELEEVFKTVIPMPSRILPSPYRQVSTADASSSEGCVAAEHLKGYSLQHKTNLWRGVLCSRGFCATPNHAIIVGGKLTSLKKLCLQ